MVSRPLSVKNLLQQTLDENPGFKKAYDENPILVTKAFATGALAMSGEAAHVKMYKDEALPYIYRWLEEASVFIRKVRREERAPPPAQDGGTGEGSNG